MGNHQSPKLAICIPVRNERDSLRWLLREIEEVSGQLEVSQVLVVVFDDFSSDGTTAFLEGEAFNNFETLVRTSSAHVGKSVALAGAFDLALRESSDLLVMMDGDGQDDPAELHKFIDALVAGSDFVNGRRVNRAHGPLKVLSSKAFNAVARLLTGVKFWDINSGYKGFSSSAASQIQKNLRGSSHRLIVPATISLGFRVTETRVTNRKRLGGKSKYGGLRGLAGLSDLLIFTLVGRESVGVPRFLVWSAIGTPVPLVAVVLWKITVFGGSLWLVTFGAIFSTTIGLIPAFLIFRLRQLGRQIASLAGTTYRDSKFGTARGGGPQHD